MQVKSMKMNTQSNEHLVWDTFVSNWNVTVSSKLKIILFQVLQDHFFTLMSMLKHRVQRKYNFIRVTTAILRWLALLMLISVYCNHFKTLDMYFVATNILLFQREALKSKFFHNAKLYCVIYYLTDCQSLSILYVFVPFQDHLWPNITVIHINSTFPRPLW